MKINISMSEKESEMWMGFLDRMVKQLAMSGMYEDDEDEDSDSGEEYPAPIEFEKAKKDPPLKQIVVEPEGLTAHQKLGKRVMHEMLDLWLINFDTEGDQPDRGQWMQDIARDGKKAGALVSFAMARKGLSIAVYEVLREKYGDDYSPVKARNIAANITQISSVYLTPLADQYKYPNPLPTTNEATS